MLVNEREYEALWIYVRDEIKKNCIAYGDMPGKIPGTRYDWMFYLKRALYQPATAFAISKMFLFHMERISPKLDFQICGMETAGSPLVTALSLTAMYFGKNLNGFVCRKERKEYGLLNRFEGDPQEGRMTAIIDDLCNSGRSMLDCLNALGEEGYPVMRAAFSIVNKSSKEENKMRDRYLPKEIVVISLFTLEDFDLSISN